MRVTLRRILAICIIKWTNECYNFGQSETGCFGERQMNCLTGLVLVYTIIFVTYVLLIIHSQTLVLVYG